MISVIFNQRFFCSLLVLSMVLTCNLVGMLVCIMGVPSSGKSSICRVLKKMLHDSAEIIEVDWVGIGRVQELSGYQIDPSKELLEILREAEEIAGGEHELQDLETKFMHKKTMELLDVGKHVIWDLVGFTDEDIPFLQELQVPVLLVLVHCSLTMHIEHLCKRNASGQPWDRRMTYPIISFFRDLFEQRKFELDYLCGLLHSIEFDTVFSHLMQESGVAQEHASYNAEFLANCQFVNMIKEYFGLHKTTHVEITPKNCYDLYVDTTFQSSQECAEIIKAKIESDFKSHAIHSYS